MLAQRLARVAACWTDDTMSHTPIEVKENLLAAMKLSIAWLMHLQPDEVGKWLAIVYTAAQLYVLVRDKIVRKRRARRDALATTSPGDLA